MLSISNFFFISKRIQSLNQRARIEARMPSRQHLSPDPRQKLTVIFIAITTLATLIIIFAVVYFLYYLWYSLVHRSRTSPFDSNEPLVKLQRFSYRELRKATHGFSESNSIGKGGSGSVFRGCLRDGKMVAVKVLDCGSLQEFQNEIQILGGIRSPLVVSLVGYCVEKDKRLVVYDYMANRSLQESLFSDTGLDWGIRFDVILDVSKALAFLHLECDPPVVHGDVKPSNVLLDSEFKAKLSDFGLSRLKLEGDFGVDLFSQDLGKSQELWKSQDLSGNLLGTGGTQTPISTPVESHHDEVDFAMALQASSSSKNSAKITPNVRALGLNSFSYNAVFETDDKRNGKGKEVENGGVEEWSKFGHYDDELSSSIDHSKELNLGSETQWGRDWWWKQGDSGELCTKDYVMEWIGSQICPSANPDWDDQEKKCSTEKTSFSKFEESKEAKKGFELEKKPKKMKEWWKEEHLNELDEKKRNKCITRFRVPHFDLGKKFILRTRSRGLSGQIENAGDAEREFSFRRGSSRRKKKNLRYSIGSEMWSGDMLSSTTSMRGTLCYVAPEYSTCGYLMEKADIYSLGVLILVIVSGRRPLHVLNSPMKLERANLISWCRQLAQAGNVLELVDERLRGEYDKDQASLCINLALACLQRMPELRPDIGDVVKILKGEMDLPSLPFEFSPSPPSRSFHRSRRRQKSNAESVSK